MIDVIFIVTGIAAFLSAIAALVVVWQNYKQRTESYRPKLVLVKTTVRLQSFEKTQGLPQVVDDNDNPQISIPIVNIGLGAARDLKVTWEFPISQVVSSVNRRVQKSLERAYYDFQDGFLSMRSDTPSWSIVWRNEKKAELDYVLPASIQQAQPDQIRLPKTYLALVIGYYHFAHKSRSLDTPDPPKVFSIPDPPELECQLAYLDIGGTKHSLDLAIEVSPVAISGNEFIAVVQSSLRNNR